jgi:hypothetical protein
MARLREGDLAQLREMFAPPHGPEPEPENWLERTVHRRIIVHTPTGESIEGTLVHAHADGVLLWSAKFLLHPTPVDLDGEVFIPRDQVLFVQTVRT